jgi:hypothetical protein
MKMSHISQRAEVPMAIPSSQEMLDQGVDPNTLDVLTDEEKHELLRSLENL